MGTLLDTSVLINLERDRASVPITDQMGMSAVTVSELLFGVLRADRAHRGERRAFVETILRGVPAIPFSEEVARVHAELRVAVESRGRKRSPHDLMIAATAVSLGWDLATTGYKGFDDIPGLRVRYV